MNSKTLTCIVVLVLLALPLRGWGASYAAGAYGGFAPSLGGDLHTAQYYSEFQSHNGIDGMNRSMEGYDTGRIDRILGVTCGMLFKTIFYDYYQVRIAMNYTWGYFGGSGKTVFDDGGTTRLLDCEYSFWEADIPVTFGISIPFWKDIRIAFSCGLAYAYADYSYRFESSTGQQWKGSFAGWGLPLVIILEGEYFVTENVAASTSLVYYKGSTKVLKDGSDAGGTDFARIDFSGYRYSLGVTYYFGSI